MQLNPAVLKVKTKTKIKITPRIRPKAPASEGQRHSGDKNKTNKTSLNTTGIKLAAGTTADITSTTGIAQMCPAPDFSGIAQTLEDPVRTDLFDTGGRGGIGSYSGR